MPFALLWLFSLKFAQFAQCDEKRLQTLDDFEKRRYSEWKLEAGAVN